LKISSIAIFLDQVEIVACFKYVQQANDIRVRELLHDSNFAKQAIPQIIIAHDLLFIQHLDGNHITCVFILAPKHLKITIRV
jgi:hypothetical protein